MRYMLSMASLLVALGVFGQVDNQSWSSFAFKVKLDDKSHVVFKPIVRHIDNISQYQNSSIDIAYSRKLGSGLSAQVLGRQWFLQDGAKRTFWWLDIAHQSVVAFGTLNNRIRYHHAIDIDDVPAPDFIRYMLTYTPKVDWAVTPFLAFEPWFRLNGSNQLERFRVEPGVKVAFQDGYSFKFVFRRQESLNLDPGSKQNQLIVNFTKVLQPKTSSK